MVNRVKQFCSTFMFAAIRVFAAGLCLVLLVPSFFSTKADNEKSEKLNVAMYDLYPFYTVDADGNASGLNHEILSYLFSSLDIPYKINIMPLGRVLQGVAQGQYDFTASYRLPDLFPQIRYLEPYACSQIILMPLKSSGIETLKDVAGKRVTYVQGGRFDHLYSSSDKFTALPSPTVPNMFRLAARNRVDAIIGNRVHLNSYKNDPMSRHLLPPDFWETLNDAIPIMPIEVSFSMARNSSFLHLIPAIEAFTKLKSTQDKFAEIISSYGDPTGGRCNLMKKNQISFSDAINGTNSEKLADHQR